MEALTLSTRSSTFLSYWAGLSLFLLVKFTNKIQKKEHYQIDMCKRYAIVGSVSKKGQNHEEE